MDMVRVRDSVRIRDSIRDRVRIRARVSVKDTQYGLSTTHFDDLQTQTVDQRVISGGGLLRSVVSVMVGSGRGLL